MGKVLSSYVKRPFKNYNVESRAHKYIEKAIPKAAPRHPSTIHHIERQALENPYLRDVIQRKDDKLLGHLKDVYVTATLVERVEASATNRRTLPSHQRWPVPPKSEAAADKTRSVTEGKITVIEATELLTEHHERDADDVDLKAVASKYRLNEDVTLQILKHFSTLQLYIPPKGGSDSQEDSELPSVFVRPEKQKTLK